MKIVIPLPFWTPKAYDICMDEYRGGWRFFAIVIKSEPHAGYWNGWCFARKIRLIVGFGVRFPAIEQLDAR
jgi:hypothetical protein